jgi:hypothetical protein
MSIVNFYLRNFLRNEFSSEGAAIIDGEESYVNRVLNHSIDAGTFKENRILIRYLGVTKNFKEVIDYFKVAEGETPPGFRVEYIYENGGVLRADLKRDISYDRNGIKRPTKVLFSADSANPYEIEPAKNVIANLTCNPGIIYDLFINNAKANVGKKFKNRDEVMEEIGRILGPGCDISVELNNPFNHSLEAQLEEAAKFREMLSPYRLVMKVPHTGPVNAENVEQLLTGDKKLKQRFDVGSTSDKFHGHNLALLLHENGYRVNFTLMFEPYQTALALQARPYFINTFVRHRLGQSANIHNLLDLYNTSSDNGYLVKLRDFMIASDYLSPEENNMTVSDVKKMAERILKYRNFYNPEGSDGLDSARHSLRVLRKANLPDTRLIICSMEGELNYPDIDKMLAEDEFMDMSDRVVITAEPEYLAKFTCTNLVVAYQRRFMNAAHGQQ